MTTNYSEDSYKSLLREAIKAIRRRWPLMLAVSLTMVATIYIILLFISDKYEANAKLMVKLGRENVEVPLTVEKGAVNSMGVQKEEVNTYISLLTSRTLIEATVDKLGIERFTRQPPPHSIFQRVKFYLKEIWKGFNEILADSLDFLGLKKKLGKREGIIKSLTKNLNVLQERDSNVIMVTLRYSDPQLAVEVLDETISRFFQQHSELYQSSNLHVMFDDQVQAQLKELDRIQGNITKIKAKWGITSVNEQRSKLIERLYKVKHELDESEAHLIMLRETQRMMNNALKRLPSNSLETKSVQNNPRMEQILQRRTELQLERNHKSEFYANNAEIVQALDQEIASLNALLANQEKQQTREMTYRRDALHDKFHTEIESNKVSLSSIEAGMAEKRNQLKALEEELNQLELGAYELKIAEMTFSLMEHQTLKYASRKEEARIDEVLDQLKIANVAILSKPNVSEEPVSPPRLLIIVLGFAASLFLGFLAALTVEWREEKVYEESDLNGVNDLSFLGYFLKKS